MPYKDLYNGRPVTNTFSPLDLLPIWDASEVDHHRVAQLSDIASYLSQGFSGDYKVVSDQAARDSIDPSFRKEGLITYDQSTGWVWRLEGGITNSDWVRFDRGCVYTEGQLVNALSDPSCPIIILKRDITLNVNVTIPMNFSLLCNGFKLIRGSASYLRVEGTILDGRYQIFDGWSSPGLVWGRFAGKPKFPEWWGLDDGASGNPAQTGQHQIAINCAIKTWNNSSINTSNGTQVEGPVSLANRPYYISDSIDMTHSHAALLGTPRCAWTEIRTTPAWNSSFKVHQWPMWGAGQQNVAAIVWFGSNAGSDHDMRSSIEDIIFDGFEASKIYAQWMINNPGQQRRLTHIGIPSSAQEITAIRNCTFRYSNGSFIAMLRSVGNNGMNGLVIENMWAFGLGMSPDCVGILNLLWGSERTVMRDITITGFLNSRANSTAYNVSVPACGWFYLNSQPNNGETVSFDGYTYTFKNTLTSANDVLIDGTKESTLDNLINAINGGAGSGSKYHASTVPNPDWDASRPTPVPWGNFFRLMAKTPGTTFNSRALSSTVSGTSGWTRANTLGGENPLGTTPSWQYHPVLIGIVHAGRGTRAENIHLEHVCIGHFFLEDRVNGNQPLGNLVNSDIYYSMYPKQRYLGDPVEKWEGPPPPLGALTAMASLDGRNGSWAPFYTAAAVVISSQPGASTPNAVRAHVSVENVRVRSDAGYLLIDNTYGQWVHAIGSPPVSSSNNADMNNLAGVLHYYMRTNSWRPPSGEFPNFTHNNTVTPGSNLPNDRGYIIGPFYSKSR